MVTDKMLVTNYYLYGIINGKRVQCILVYNDDNVKIINVGTSKSVTLSRHEYDLFLDRFSEYAIDPPLEWTAEDEQYKIC